LYTKYEFPDKQLADADVTFLQLISTRTKFFLSNLFLEIAFFGEQLFGSETFVVLIDFLVV